VRHRGGRTGHRHDSGVHALQHRPPSNGAQFPGSVDLEIDMLRPRMTDYAAMIPGVELRGPITLGYQAADFAAAYNLIEVVIVLAGAR
jgi:D-amino peptidase